MYNQLAAVKWPPALRYAVDVAEARVALAEHETQPFVGFYKLTGDRLAVENATELVKTTPSRPAGHLLLAEAWLAANGPEEAVKACDRYLMLAGDDPDAFAVRAAARLRLGKDVLAIADFAKSLALDPYQPRAMRWKWETTDSAGRLKMARLLASAPDPTTLYRTLTTDAEHFAYGEEHDWAAYAALGEEYRKVRPKDARGVGLLAEAYARAKRAADAGKLLTDAMPKLHLDARPDVVRRFVRAMDESGQLDAAYALVPKAQARLAFEEVSEVMLYAYRLPKDQTKELWTQALKPVKALLDTHTKVDPEDPWPAVIDGLVKNYEREYARAAELLSAALKRPPFNDPAETHFLYRFDALRRELIVARYHTGRGVDAYRELPVDARTFNWLATHYESDSDAVGLTALIQARTKREGDVPDNAFWRGEVRRLAGEHAQAARNYRDYLAGKPSNSLRDRAHEQLIRSLVKAGDGAAALKQSEFDHPKSFPHLLALHATGKSADAEKLVREFAGDSRDRLVKPYTAPLYADPDLGKVLRSDPAFAAFRKEYPPPAEPK